MAVLIAEKDALLAMSLSDAVVACGEEVIGPTPTMNEALQMAARQPPEFALVGFHLGDGKTGKMLARVLRETFGAAVFLVTADTRVTCDNTQPAMGILRKPYPLESVAKVLAIARKIRAGESISVSAQSGIEICSTGK